MDYKIPYNLKSPHKGEIRAVSRRELEGGDES